MLTSEKLNEDLDLLCRRGYVHFVRECVPETVPGKRPVWSNERRIKQGEQPVKAAQWREMMEQKAFRGKFWKVFGMEQFMRGMWEHVTVKRASAKAVLADAEKEKQEGIQGKWQLETPFNEVLAHTRKKKNSDMSCNAYHLGDNNYRFDVVQIYFSH